MVLDKQKSAEKRQCFISKIKKLPVENDDTYHFNIHMIDVAAANDLVSSRINGVNKLDTERGSKYYLSYEKNGKIKNVEIKLDKKSYIREKEVKLLDILSSNSNKFRIYSNFKTVFGSDLTISFTKTPSTIKLSNMVNDIKVGTNFYFSKSESVQQFYIDNFPEKFVDKILNAYDLTVYDIEVEKVSIIDVVNEFKIEKTNEWVMDYKFNNHKERLSINPSGLETEKMLRFLKEKRNDFYVITDYDKDNKRMLFYFVSKYDNLELKFTNSKNFRDRIDELEYLIEHEKNNQIKKLYIREYNESYKNLKRD